jgi:hypothetical protein
MRLAIPKKMTTRNAGFLSCVQQCVRHFIIEKDENEDRIAMQNGA